MPISLRNLYIIGVILFLIFIIAIVIQEQRQTELRGDEMATLKIKHGENFTIFFNGNPTTGYTWESQLDTNYIKLNWKKFEPSSKSVGAGGKERFEFQAIKNGETEIVFIYKRPWEKEAVDKKVYKIIIE
ncbi:Chagasin family peptidase inhibitor I42 [uncultured archaeon]|nr:Chagasin family peptidase inhibitor I42 [uncultured archaeon]